MAAETDPLASTPPAGRAGSAPAASPGLARCGGCGVQSALLRRGRCPACYRGWLKARPVGLGASCASCDDRRLVHLRWFEVHGMWVVLCHNCTARAERVEPLPHSVDGLLVALRRERRHGGDRRDEAASPSLSGAAERRGGDRRSSERSAVDVTDLAVETDSARAAVGEIHGTGR